MSEPTVVVSLDEESVRVIVDALDMYQRVAMGQWREVAEGAPDVLGLQAAAFSSAADALMEVRCSFAAVEALRADARASLSIAQTHRPARVAYDLWHALGGGMPSRRSMRLTDVHVSVSESPAALPVG